MKPKKSPRPTKPIVNIEAALEDWAKRLSGCRALQKGHIVVRTAEDGQQFCLECSDKGVVLRQGAGASSPKIEIIGNAREIRGVLSGEKDARSHFLAGGFRLRGDLRYLSDLALELGILTEPL